MKVATGCGHELPFIIGISGHRDVAHLISEPQSGTEGVKQAIKECLLYWKNQLNEFTPIWLMTGMAKGADLLAIDAIDELIAEDADPSKFKVVPCLSMPQTAFEMDFANSPELDQFQALMRQYSDNSIILCSKLPQERYAAALVDSYYGNDRNSLYMNLAGFLARVCNVVICVWDGLDAKGAGGTADVVKLKLGMDLSWPIEEQFVSRALMQPESLDRHFGGVIQYIPVNRAKPSSQPSLVENLLKTTSGIEHNDYPCFVSSSLNNETESICQRDQSLEFKTLLKQLANYNSDIQADIREDICEFPHPALSDSAQQFNVADRFAVQFQSAYRKRMVAFFTASLLGLGGYELVGNYLGLSLGIGLTALILLATLFCVVMVKSSKKRQWKRRYQIARGVAESLRIRGFLNMAAIEPDNHPLLQRCYKHNFPIFEQAIMIAELECWKYDKLRNDENIRDNWLNEQKGFLAKRLRKESWFTSPSTVIFQRPLDASWRLGLTARVLFVAAIVVGFLLLLLQINIYIGSESWASAEFAFWMMVFIQYAIMIAGAAALWSELASYDGTASGYVNLIQLYEVALNNLAAGDEKLIQLTLRTLAKEALLEHCEWSRYESQSDIQARG